MFFKLLVFFIFLLSLFSFLPGRHWWLEFISNYTPYLAVLTLFLLPLAGRAFRNFRIGFSLFCALTFLMAAAAFLMPFARYLQISKDDLIAGKEKESVKVAYLELFGEIDNSEPCPTSADIVLVSGSKATVESLQCGSFSVFKKEIDKGHMLALFTHLPARLRTDHLGEDLSTGLLVADLTAKSGDLAVVLFNLPPVFSKDVFRNNRIFLRRLASLFRHDTKEVLIVANLGATALSSNFNIFRLAGRLRPETGIIGKMVDPGCPFPLLNCVHFFSAGGIILRDWPINIIKRQAEIRAQGMEVVFFD
jgi:hypothetical protein